MPPNRTLTHALENSDIAQRSGWFQTDLGDGRPTTRSEKPEKPYPGQGGDDAVWREDRSTAHAGTPRGGWWCRTETVIQVTPVHSCRGEMLTMIAQCYVATFVTSGHAIGDEVAKRGSSRNGLRSCTCASRISETAGRVALKFGLWLETH